MMTTHSSLTYHGLAEEALSWIVVSKGSAGIRAEFQALDHEVEQLLPGKEEMVARQGSYIVEKGVAPAQSATNLLISGERQSKVREAPRRDGVAQEGEQQQGQEQRR